MQMFLDGDSLLGHGEEAQVARATEIMRLCSGDGCSDEHVVGESRDRILERLHKAMETAGEGTSRFYEIGMVYIALRTGRLDAADYLIQLSLEEGIFRGNQSDVEATE